MRPERGRYDASGPDGRRPLSRGERQSNPMTDPERLLKLSDRVPEGLSPGRAQSCGDLLVTSGASDVLSHKAAGLVFASRNAIGASCKTPRRQECCNAAFALGERFCDWRCGGRGFPLVERHHAQEGVKVSSARCRCIPKCRESVERIIVVVASTDPQQETAGRTSGAP